MSVIADLYNAVGNATCDALPLVVNATLKRTYELESESFRHWPSSSLPFGALRLSP